MLYNSPQRRILVLVELYESSMKVEFLYENRILEWLEPRFGLFMRKKQFLQYDSNVPSNVGQKTIPNIQLQYT